MKKTKIIGTIGPASLSLDMLYRMHHEGMDGARINTAYGTLDQYKLIIDNVREIASIPVIVDIKGPEIRLRVGQKKAVNKGDIIEAGFGLNSGEITFNNDFIDKISIGDSIYIDNGKIRTQIVEKDDVKLRLLVMTEGVIDNGKGVNIPYKQLKLPTLSRRDLEIIELAKAYDVEYIALSFTRDAKDVNELKSKAEGFKGAIIAKIENREGVNNINEILDAADGIMVARGDLAVEIEPEKVPLVQKSIIKLCNQKGKIVVTATEMLESMMVQPTPTRAEVSDVANAILDGTDSTMLSGETAVGKYPVESVSMMSRVARETEAATRSHVEEGEFTNISDTISKAVQRICQDMPISKVVTLTRSGYTAKMITRFRIKQLVIAVTPDERVKKQLELVYGVYPVNLDYLEEEDRTLAVASKLYAMNLVDDGDTVLFTAAYRTIQEHASNLIEVHNIKELKGLFEH